VNLHEFEGNIKQYGTTSDLLFNKYFISMQHNKIKIKVADGDLIRLEMTQWLHLM
jgi:hypothetical protein